MAQCSLIFIPNLYRSTCTFAIVCAATDRKLPDSICILSFYMPSFSLLCLFSPFFIFIFLLHLVLDFLIRGLYFLCRFGACNEMCGHFKWRNEPTRNTNLDCLSIKEKKSQHERERNAKMEHLCWISVPYSSCHQFHSMQTRLFYFTIQQIYVHRTMYNIYLCAPKGANTNEHLINEQQYECWRCWWFN